MKEFFITAIAALVLAGCSLAYSGGINPSEPSISADAEGCLIGACLSTNSAAE
jgi:hypothetical protein